MKWTGGSALFFFIFSVVPRTGDGYVVGTGLSVRFGQLLYTDGKYQALRQKLLSHNLGNLTSACSSSYKECENALYRNKYKPSKDFFMLAKAVVDYLRFEKKAKPIGYVGVPVFCSAESLTCSPDADPPTINGGCQPLISCGGNATWYLEKMARRRLAFYY